MVASIYASAEREVMPLVGMKLSRGLMRAIRALQVESLFAVLVKTRANTNFRVARLANAVSGNPRARTIAARPLIEKYRRIMRRRFRQLA